MAVREALLPKRYHDAVVHWRETFMPDFDFRGDGEALITNESG